MAGEEVFRGATPDYAEKAYAEEAQVAARVRSTTEEYLDARERGVPSVEFLPGSDIAAELAKKNSRLDSWRKSARGLVSTILKAKWCHLAMYMQMDSGRWGRLRDQTRRWTSKSVNIHQVSLLSAVKYMVRVPARGKSRLKQSTSSSLHMNASVCSTNSSMSSTKGLLSCTKGQKSFEKSSGDKRR